MSLNTTAKDYHPLGTRVLNTQDGEPGTILNGYCCDPERGWIEYEVATAYGIERWSIEDMLCFDEMGIE